MANKTGNEAEGENRTLGGADIKAMLERKLALLRKVLALSQQQLLLVDLEDLSPLLQRKDDLLAEMERVDHHVAEAGLEKDPRWVDAVQQTETAQLAAAVLENDQRLEQRIAEEFTQLKKDMREFDQQRRLKKYLEGQRQDAGTFNLKK